MKVKYNLLQEETDNLKFQQDTMQKQLNESRKLVKK